ncbi:MAG TPA: M56 family metallopeptidase [Candidatus Eremiobacteraceae bacterium]|nr:M56 family metallopeptidase [Candidatus Eremiobacteraceae bacterium]
MSILHHLLWALVNSIWQSTTLAALVFIALRLVRRSTAAQRYAIWSAVLVACALLPAVDLALSEGWISNIVAHPIVAQIVPVRSTAFADNALQDSQLPPGRWVLTEAPAQVTAPLAPLEAAARPTLKTVQISPQRFWQILQPPSWAIGALAGRYDAVLFFVWFVVANLLVARLVLGYRRLCVIKRDLLYRSPTERECEVFHAMTLRPVTIGYSSAINEPCVIGFTQPAIALPIGLAEHLSADDVSRIMRHECAHIARWDDYGNLCKQIITALAFFNPIVQYVSKVTDVEREIACDDAVALAEADRILYAKCLYELARSHARGAWLPANGLIYSKRQIVVRIKRLLDSNHRGSTRLSALAKFAVIAVVASAVPVAYVQLAASGSQVKLPHTPAVAQPVIIVAERANAEPVTPPLPVTSVEPAAAPKVLPVARHMQAVKPKPAIKPKASLVAPRLVAPKIELNLELSTAVDAADAALARSAEQVEGARLHELDARLAMLRAQHGHTKWFIIGSATAAAARVDAAVARTVFAGYHDPRSHQQEHDDFLRALHDTGFNNLSVDELIAIRNAGVSSSFLRELHAAGMTPMSIADLIVLANEGVDAAYLAAVSKTSYGNLSIKEVVALRNAGVTPRFVTSLGALGYHPSVAEMIRLANAGVDGQYIESLAHVGYQKISVDDLIRLRDSGVTAGFIARLQESHLGNYGHLAVDDLIKLCNAGI